MRKTVAGLAIAFGSLAGVAWGQAPAGGQATPRPGTQTQGTQTQGTQTQGTQTQGTQTPGTPAPGTPAQGTQARPAGQPGQPGQPGQFSEADAQIAAFVWSKCTAEIQLAQFAEQRAQTDEVRQFAQKMAEDHSPGCQMLHQIAGMPAAVGGQAGRAGQAGPPGVRATGHFGGQTGAAGGAVNWTAIHSEIAQQCLQSTRETLSTQHGIDFDKGFMSQQELAHLELIAALKAVRTQASAQLRQPLDQELQTAQQHLQLAKQIMQQVKERPSERVSRRTTESK